jgi:hypothetical protein
MAIGSEENLDLRSSLGEMDVSSYANLVSTICYARRGAGYSRIFTAPGPDGYGDSDLSVWDWSQYHEHLLQDRPEARTGLVRDSVSAFEGLLDEGERDKMSHQANVAWGVLGVW